MGRTHGVWCCAPLCAAVWLWGLPGLAGEAKSPAPAAAQPADNAVVELFAAIDSGQVDAKLIAADSRHCRLLLTNKTERPLSVVFPAAFAAAPVLAQFGPDQRQADKKASQTLGTAPQNDPFGRNNFNNAPRNNRNGPNFFNLPPGKTSPLKLDAVCLEYGRPEPSAHVAYEIKPLASAGVKPGVFELCALLADPEVNRQAVQAAAWHLNNDLGWDELKSKVIKTPSRLLSPREPLFAAADLKEAQRLADEALKTAQEKRPEKKGKSLADGALSMREH